MEIRIVRTSLAFLAGFVFFAFLVASKDLVQAAEDYEMERNRLQGALEAAYRQADELGKIRNEALDKGDRKAREAAEQEMIKTAEKIRELEEKDPMVTEAVQKKLEEQRENDVSLGTKLGFVLGEGIKKVGEATGLREEPVTIGLDEQARLALEAGYRRTGELAKRRDEAMEKGDRKAAADAQQEIENTAFNMMKLEKKHPIAAEEFEKKLKKEGEPPLDMKLAFALGEGIKKIGEVTGLREGPVTIEQEGILKPDEMARLALEAGYRRTGELAKLRDEAMEKGDHKAAAAAQQEIDKTALNMVEIEGKHPIAAMAFEEKLKKEMDSEMPMTSKMGRMVGDLIKQFRGSEPESSSDLGKSLLLDKGREKKAEGKPSEKVPAQGGEGAKETAKREAVKEEVKGTVKEEPKEPVSVSKGEKAEGEWTTLTTEGVQKEIGKAEESLAEYAAKIKEQEGKLGLLDTQIQGIEDDWGSKTHVLAVESGRLKALADQMAEAGQDTSSVMARFDELLKRQRVIDHERMEKMGPPVEMRRTTENEMRDLAFHRDNMENERSHFVEVLGMLQEKSVEMNPEPENVNVDAAVDALLLEASEHSPVPGDPSEEERRAMMNREANLLSGEVPTAEEKSADESATETYEMRHEPMDQPALPEIEEEVVEHTMEDMGEDLSEFLDVPVELPDPAEIAREVTQQAAEDKIVTDKAKEADDAEAAAHNPDMM